MHRAIGLIVLCASTAMATPSSWTGAGSDTSVGTSANWDWAETVAHLTDGSLLVTFANGGTSAGFDRATSLDGLVLNVQSGGLFALTKGNDSASLGLGASGISAQTGTLRVDVPVVVNGDQTWEIGANATVTNVTSLRQGASPVNYAITKTGTGNLYLNGDGTGDFRGDFNVTGGGLVYAFGEDPFGRASEGGGGVKISGSSAKLARFGTSTHTKPVTIAATYGDGDSVQVLSGSTVTFKGAFTSSYDRVFLASKSKVILAGGGRLEAPLYFSDDKSEVVITNKPVYLYGGASYATKGTVTFAVPSNDVPQLLTWYGINYHCAADWAFYKGDSQISIGNYYDQFYGHWDLGGHDQRVDYLRGAKNVNELRNTGKPATLYMTGRTPITNYGPFTGAFNLSKGGSARYDMGGANGPVVNTSTGYLEVTGGTLAFSAGSSWAQSTDVRIDASGDEYDAVLEANDSGVLGSEAAVELKDGAIKRAVLDIAEHAVMIVKTLTVNGTTLAGGKTYGSSSSSAEVKDDVHFAGKGVIRPTDSVRIEKVDWTGAGTDALPGTAANWSWTSAVGHLNDGILWPIFAKGGDRMLLDQAVKFEGVVFDAPSKAFFAIDKGTDSASIGIGQSGLTATTRDSVGVFGVNVPVVVNGDQTWEIGANVTVTNVTSLKQGASPVDYAITKTGTGNLYLNGDGTGDFRGDFNITEGGLVYAFGEDPFGRAAEGGGVKISGSSAKLVRFGDSTHTKPVTVTATYGDNTAVRILGGATVTFKGAFTSSYDNVYIEDKGKVILEGGGRLEAPFRFDHVESEVVITNKPVYLYGGASYSHKGTVTFAVPSNDVPQLLTWYGINYHCAADWAFYKGDSQVRIGNYYDQFYGHWDLGGHDQRVDYLIGMKDVNELRNTGKPATLYMTGRTPITNYGPFTGAFNLSKGGSARYDMGGANGPVVNTSTGYLEVTGGTLAFSAGSSWAQSTDVRIDASGDEYDAVLEVQGANALNHDVMLTLADGETKKAKLSLADGVVLPVAALVLNGRSLKGGRSYGSSQSAADVKDDGHFIGKGVIYPARSAVVEPAGWTGNGGTDGSLSTPANWDWADAVERLTDGTLLVTFASAGTAAVVDSAVDFNGIVFNTPHTDQFTLSKGAAFAEMGLGEGGLTAIARASAGTYRIDVPVVVNGDQTWEIGANATVTNVTSLRQGASPVDYAITKTGTGNLYLMGDGTGDFRGDFNITEGGLVYAFGEDPFGKGAPGGGGVRISGSSAKLVRFGDSTHTKPVTVTATYGDNTAVRILGGATVTFKGAFTSSYDNVYIEDKGKVILEGGGRLEAPFRFQHVESEVVITNKPVYLYGGASYAHKGLVTFAVPSNDVPQLLTWYGINYHCAADWAFYKGDSQVRIGNYYDQFYGHWDLGGHDQRVDYLIGMKDVNELRNTGKPATLYMTGRTPITNYGPFTGAFNLSKGGSARYDMGDANGPVVNTSTGYLEVTGGTLAFSAGSSWAQSTDIRIDASGDEYDAVLELNDGAALSRRTNLVMTDGNAKKAKLYLADGVAATIRKLVLNGRELGGVTCGSSQSNADVKDDVHFAGTGTVFVRGTGSVIMIR